MCNFLQVRKMTVQERTSDSQEIGMSRIVYFHHTPWVLSGAHAAAANLDDFFSADNGEGHETAKFGVFFDGVLVIFFDVVGEVVDRNAVVFDVFHDELLGFSELGGGERIGLADDGDDIDTGRKAFHEFDVEFAEAEGIQLVLRCLFRGRMRYLPMTSGSDEVEQSVHTIISEPWITLDT